MEKTFTSTAKRGLVEAHRGGRVSTRLLAGFGLVVALTAASCGYSIHALFESERVARHLSTHDLRAMQDAAEMKNLVELNGLRIAAAARLGEHEYAEELEKDRQSAAQRLEGIKVELTGIIEGDASLRELFDALSRQRTELVGMEDRIRELQRQDEYVKLESLLSGPFEKARRAYATNVDEFLLLARSRADASTARAGDVARTALWVSTVLVVLSSMFGLIFALRLSRSIARPLQAVIAQARAIARGDLSSHIQRDGRGEILELQEAIAEMRDGLVSLVSQVHMTTDSISSGSSEIASGNQDLSNRTEETASNLQRTVSTMAQVTQVVQETSSAATQANTLACAAADVARRGGALVAEVISTMGEINEASTQIGDITTVIDGIAFQTNILALNAAVEAARAGEHGRGFAVVAAEVRALAQRSAQAAREIKTLIADSGAKVASGTGLVHKAGETMNEIVVSSGRVTDIVQQITRAVQHQSTSLDEVGSAMRAIDEMTQQNAALVEESAAAAASLKTNAEGLSKHVTQFKLAA